jgi:hypothetical protein
MTNLTRAKEAFTCFMETEERRQRGRHSPSEGRLCVKTDSKAQQRDESKSRLVQGESPSLRGTRSCSTKSKKFCERGV